MAIEIKGRTYGGYSTVGALLALLVLVACFVTWLVPGAVATELIVGMIAALAVAYLIG